MNMNIIQRAFLLVLLGIALDVTTMSQSKGSSAAPTSAPASERNLDPPIRLPTDLVQFFSGEWTGAGEFASGKKIEADVSFTPVLDGQWLVYSHTDRAPGRYKALGMWGFESSSKKLIMVVNDNFGGARLFSSEGWLNGKLVFLKSGALAPQGNASPMPPTNRERFTFERQADDAFKMTYEVSKDGISWRVGDYLIFRKKR